MSVTDLMPGSKISWDSNIDHHEIRLIGIGGKKRHGKDTVADHLVDKYGWVKLGMSDPLDIALQRENPYVRIEPGEAGNLAGKRAKFLLYSEIRAGYDYVTAKTITNVRDLLKRLGTEVGRELIGENTWVDVADTMIYDLLAEGKNVILTGARFPNELAMVNKYENGETWYVTRPGFEDGEADTHASETSVSEEDFSVVIKNDSDLDTLYENVDNLMADRQKNNSIVVAEVQGSPDDE
jgi:hypothetical protein